MAKHALLSPSGSHRWMHCTPSAMLEKDIPNKGSDYTREGTLAHAYCAKDLKTYLGKSTHVEDIEIEELNDPYYTDEMPTHVESYVSIVTEKFEEAKKKTPDAVLMVEQLLDFSEWIPGSFGTADAIIVADGTMEVIDFKYGKGVEVSAKRNSQMMIYALGAIAKYSDDYRIDKVRMTIVQPRLNNLSEYELSYMDLIDWASTELVPKALDAMEGRGEQKAGDWCQFCRARNQCKCLAQHCMEDFDAFQAIEDKSELMTPEDIAKLLPKLPTIKKWAESMDKYALEQALNGTKFPGFKLVEGRSNRVITDEDEAVNKLTDAGFQKEVIMKPSTLKGITELESIVHGKKKLATLLGDIIVKPKGKPTLVSSEDERPAIDDASSDFDEITN